MVVFDKDNFIKKTTVKHTEHNIFDLWEKEIKKVEKATVCLSGGLDSQFTAQVVKKYCKDVEYVCFVYKWNNTIVNTDDVVACQEFAKLAKIYVDYRDINLKQKLDVDILTQYAVKYRFVSPQLAVLMQCIDTLDKSRTIFMGAERPFLMVCPDGKVALLGFKQDALAKHKINSEDYPYLEGLHSMLDNHYFPLINFAKQNNIKFVRDLFYMSPEILYQAVTRWADIIDETGLVDRWTKEQYVNGKPPLQESDQYHTSKSAYYDSYGFEFYKSLSKKTGFENLQKHLASTSGYYDEFDVRYREIMHKATNKKDFKKPIQSWKCSLTGDTNQMFEVVQNKIDHIQPEPYPLHVKYIW